MELKRLEDLLKIKDYKDVFQRNAIIVKMQENYRKVQTTFSESMIRLGKCITQTASLILTKLKSVLSAAGCRLKNKSVLAADKIGDFIVGAIKKIACPIAGRKQCSQEIRNNLHKARKSGKPAFVKELFKCIGLYYSGAGKVASTVFNYAAPVVSVAFLIGIINYVSGLEYGLSVEYKGQEIAVVNAETDFNTAAKEVQKRITSPDGNSSVDFTPQFSLKILNSSDELVSSSQLADKLLSNSDAELTDAYGIYLDDEFVGAVISKDEIEKALSNMLSEYKTGVNASEVKFSKNIEYKQGLYLTDSISSTDSVMNLLKSSNRVSAAYTVTETDTPIVIAQKCNMSLEELTSLNPDKINNLVAGDVLNIKKTVSFLPIEYTRVLQTTSYIDYQTVQVQTNKLYEGHTAVMQEGVKGECTNVINAYYVDGMETSRETVSSTVTKEPVNEEIGVGTYAATPSSSSTVLSGNGQFCWPVNGGYISDPFLSNRNHKGMDIAAPSGTEIYAAADGEVIYAGWDSGGYGNCVRIDHGNGYVTVYGHMSSINVSVGQTLSQGDLIGGVGTTGDSTGNHLHFEVRYNGIPTDPAQYINVND